MSKYHFFWGGPFSQWWQSEFKVGTTMYYTAEQYMMAEKARLFGDGLALSEILATLDPKKQKAWGRKVRNFDQKIWNENKVRIVYHGNKAKFTQNPDLLSDLFATEDKLIVEASPYDKVWGIGLNEQMAKVIPEKNWEGENLLGRILSQLREDLIEEYVRSCD